MPKRIKLMAEYSSGALWNQPPDGVGPIDPDDLPLQPETRFRLKRWAAVFDAMLNWEDPGNTPPWPPRCATGLTKKGLRCGASCARNSGRSMK